METTKRLLMSFKTMDDSRVSISVDEPRADITESEIKDVMDIILLKNIFAPKGMNLVSSVEAKIVVNNTTEYDLVL